MRPQDSPHEREPFPLFVQVGFSGARTLFDSTLHAHLDPIAFESRCVDQMEEVFRAIGPALGLTARSDTLVGISQMAIGADVVFARALARLGLWHRVLLPQPRDAFLAASGSKGPHFSEAQKAECTQLLQAGNVIEERVVSSSASSDERFDETSIEILDEGDVLICLFTEASEHKSGGTHDIFERAKARKKPTLELRLDVGIDGPLLSVVGWHDLDQFRLPKLPPLAANVPMSSTLPGASPMPTAGATEALKRHASLCASGESTYFKRAAAIIIATHVLATTLATIALTMHHTSREWIIPGLLSIELVLLVAGLAKHHLLHRTDAIRNWANARLIAEITRSVLAVRDLPITLDYLGRLPIPVDLRPLVRSIQILHMVTTHRLLEPSTRKIGKTTLDGMSRAYLATRLEGAEGQVAYYGREERKAATRLGYAQWAFVLASSCALVATACKLAMSWRDWSDVVAMIGRNEDLLVFGCGLAAILLPLVAVGGLSLASAFDLEARHRTFRDTHAFLRQQSGRIARVTTFRELSGVVVETEAHLLGETLTWFARRSYLSVS